MRDDIYHLSADEIEQMQAQEKVHFLNNRARRMEKSLAAATGLGEIDFCMVEVAPGDETTEHHKHYHEEECLYVLDGEGTARIGSESREIRSGDFVGFRRGGLAHSLKNTGEGTLKCILVSQRKHHDVSDYPRMGKRLFRNNGLTWNMVDVTVIDRPFGAKT